MLVYTENRIILFVNLISFLSLTSQLWKSLGDLSKDEAMKKYIEVISRACPLFHAHLEAHKRNLEEMEQKRLKYVHKFYLFDSMQAYVQYLKKTIK